MQQEFERKYGTLNPAQKRAVDTTPGPLLVFAGPGTGKTELLSLRAAQILRTTDTEPGSILCLTFTESAQTNMQARLGALIGPTASQVAIHTFHSFGSYIIGTHSEYFQEAFGFRPSDDVTRYQILASILERLPHDMKLGMLYDDQFLYLKDIQSRISQIKQAGLAPSDFRSQVSNDQAWVEQASSLVQTLLARLERISAKELSRFDALERALKRIPSHSTDSMLSTGQLCLEELQAALELSGDKLTKPITTWKNRWVTKNGNGEYLLGATRQLGKLLELSDVYEAYQLELKKRRLFDYDDMIMRVIEALSEFPDLRADLQERYLYIMVDEFQDTNGAQLRLLRLLADSPVSGGEPNLMVVGDDDQAVYGFQGAYQSNVRDFETFWPLRIRETLKINYRSTKPILDFARQLIVQGEDRQENLDPTLDKSLIADNKNAAAKPRHEILASQVEAYGWLATQIAQAIDSGQNAQQIAVIAPKHKYLEAVVPYLEDKGIAVAYERREDVLQQPHIAQLLTLARVIMHLAGGEIDEADRYLPELLSYAWWQLDPGWLWELALQAKKTHEPWLELMRNSQRPQLQQLADWLLAQAQASFETPLEPMMDQLIGPQEPSESFSSPYRRFYFSDQTLDASTRYLRLLSGLVSLRGALREYQPDQTAHLADFVAFADLRLSATLPLSNNHPLILDTSAVQLLSAHKAKGLEFEQVYLLNVDEHTWLKEKGRSNNIALPPNYSVIAPSGDTPDEKLRLFYVSVTRAKNALTLLSFATSNQGKPVLPLGWLQPEAVQATLEKQAPATHESQSQAALTRQLGFDWMAPHFELRTQAPWKALLQKDLEHYQLSPTHLTAFLDVGRGGPKAFLVNQLLRFPQALSVSAQFGNVMHGIMQRLHTYYVSHTKLPTKKLAETWLDEIITGYYFGPIEEPKARRRGSLCLDAIYEQLGSSFNVNQRAEYSFSGEGVVIDQARLKGIIDNLELDTTAKTAHIIDYKTGSALAKWQVSAKAKSFEAHKAHRYRQQLAFYKLLVEHSRSFRGYQASLGSLVFVEPDENDRITTLDMSYDTEEMQRLTRLIQVVYQHITDLDLPDTSHFSPDFQGTLDFEAELLGG